VIPKLPFRTAATDLSEDELRLLDVQFDAAAPVRSLRRKYFLATFNSQSHDLDDAELRKTISRLCERGILCRERHNGIEYVRMTELISCKAVGYRQQGVDNRHHISWQSW